MLDLQLIDNTIDELEQADTNFNICQQLASLYIVKQYTTQQDEDIKEFNDILPRYNKYRDVKKLYQLGKCDKSCVIKAVNDTCKELTEFIHILYSGSDTKEERIILDKYFNCTHF